VGTPNPSFQKRAKEQKRKEKAEAKRLVRDAKKAARSEEPFSSSPEQNHEEIL
jgi:hypothetical protein